MKKKTLEIRVLPVVQNIGEFFVSSIPARDLVEISYSDVRRLASDPRDFERYLGIQRPVSKKRVSEIKKYLDGSDATFPTPAIVSIDERCAVYDRETGILTLSEYVPDNEDDDAIPFGKIARVIDGQHRIAAFLNEDKEWLFRESDKFSDFQFSLSIFIGADLSEQANIFATVNLAQTKVNKSLVYDLSGLAKTKSPFKACHNVAVMLDREHSSPFHGRIKRLGVATPGRSKEPLTQAAFVESLLPFISQDPMTDRNLYSNGKEPQFATKDELSKTPFRNLFLKGAEEDIGIILFNYFDAVRRKWPNSWKDFETSGNLLPRSNVFKALMKFLLEDAYPLAAGGNLGSIPSVTKYSQFFDPIDLRDDDFTTRNFVPGSGGQSTFLKLLRGQVTRSDLIEKEV